MEWVLTRLERGAFKRIFVVISGFAVERVLFATGLTCVLITFLIMLAIGFLDFRFLIPSAFLAVAAGIISFGAVAILRLLRGKR